MKAQIIAQIKNYFAVIGAAGIVIGLVQIFFMKNYSQSAMEKIVQRAVTIKPYVVEILKSSTGDNELTVDDLSFAYRYSMDSNTKNRSGEIIRRNGRYCYYVGSDDGQRVYYVHWKEDTQTPFTILKINEKIGKKTTNIWNQELKNDIAN